MQEGGDCEASGGGGGGGWGWGGSSCLDAANEGVFSIITPTGCLAV